MLWESVVGGRAEPVLLVVALASDGSLLCSLDFSYLELYLAGVTDWLWFWGVRMVGAAATGSAVLSLQEHVHCVHDQQQSEHERCTRAHFPRPA